MASSGKIQDKGTTEDAQLRSVTLQNADTIRRARQRAERELLETKDALQKQSEWLRIVLSSIADGVIATDAEGHITFLNGVAETLTGWQMADAIGRPVTEIFRIRRQYSGEEIDNPALRALHEGKVVDLDDQTVLIARDGTERHIDDSGAPMRDAAGATIGAVLIFRDVGERIGAQEIQARLAAIVESSQDAIVSKTLDGVIQSWNAGAERLFGYPAAEAIGRSIELIIPPDRLGEEREIMRHLRNGERVEHFETTRVAKGGRRIDISLTVSPLLDGAGRPVGASKVARDITLRRRAEEALREAERRKDEFLPLLAHELRNPLAPLRNGLEIIRLAEEDPELIDQARLMMERQLGHLVRLVDDLLDVSRISRNKMELRRTRLLLADVVASAVETARPMLEAGGHQLVVELSPEPIRLYADLTRLAQVFGNLLSNSSKYTPPGGSIRFSAGTEGDEIVATVRDDGIGIPTEALPHIFDMFSQVDRSIERSTGGLGIGLALVKGLVEMHGGTVSAESAGPGQGSTFTVRLPMLAARRAPTQTDLSAEGTQALHPARRILVVDDNRDSAVSMSAMLRLLGNEVRTVHDGVDALEVAEGFRPEIVLMDVGMPRLNGYDATRRLRERPWGAQPIVIALTGWGQEIDKAHSQDAGCDGHLVKPVRLADLDHVIAQIQQQRAR